MTTPTRKDLKLWNLRDIIGDLVTKWPAIESIHLFGSRARRTGSYRSDIDFIVYSQTPLPAADVAPWLNEVYNPVDLFETNDLRLARSLINGSSIVATTGTVIQKVDAVSLWTRAESFSATFDQWQQFTIIDATFIPTIFPISRDFAEVANSYHKKLHDLGLPDTHLGFDWRDVGRSLAVIVQHAVNVPARLGKRAKNISVANLVFSDEYDFQNLIHLILRPWLPSLESEPFVIKYAGQEKNADFSILGNNLVIEAKVIRSATEQASVVKQLAGLADLYSTGPNIKCLLFLILVDVAVKLDCLKIEKDFSNELKSAPIILVKVIETAFKH